MTESARSVDHNYFRLVRPQGIAAEFFALRNESADARRLLAYGATRGTLELEELYAVIRSGAPVDLHPEWAARLARIMAWQNYLPDDRHLALDIFARVVDELDGNNVRHLKLRQAYVELLLAESQFDAAWKLMSVDPTFDGEPFWHYWTDVYSPFLGSPHADRDRWAGMFNAHFERHDLVGVDVELGDAAPFDRVVGRPAESPHDDGPLVTVIMTTFRPERTPLIAAVHSILAQTWQRLELVIVDDASPDEYLPTLHEVEGLDPRIRVERMSVNGGTYLARNRALELARGEFFTNQDADDWSHPQRVERQLQPMLDDPGRPGTRAAALTLDSNLRQTRPGYGYVQQHAATFMSRVELVRSLGGYLPARRAADNELHRRVEAFTERKVLEISAPLALYRIEPDSLSRGDFRAGWSHPARQAFIASYNHWHANARTADLASPSASAASVAVPQRFRVRQPAPRDQYDLVVLTDWRFEGPPQRAGYDEVIEALRVGQRVGIIHMESPRHISPRRGNLDDSTQDLINTGRVDRVLLDDNAKIRRLVIRDPSVLQYRPIGSAHLQITAIEIAVDDTDVAVDGLWFARSNVEANCAAVFGVVPAWRLEALVASSTRFPVETVRSPLVDRRKWSADRRRWRGDAPVVGWLADAALSRKLDHSERKYLRQALGDESNLDVRIRGNEAVCRAFAGKSYAGGWTRFRPEEIGVRAFLHSVDFLIAAEPGTTSLRGILEATVSGCVILAPRGWEPFLGEAAIYVTPREVSRTILTFRADRMAFERQLSRSRALLSAEMRDGRGSEGSERNTNV